MLQRMDDLARVLHMNRSEREEAPESVSGERVLSCSKRQGVRRYPVLVNNTHACVHDDDDGEGGGLSLVVPEEGCAEFGTSVDSRCPLRL